jgi:hypothetical protein
VILSQCLYGGEAPSLVNRSVSVMSVANQLIPGFSDTAVQGPDGQNGLLADIIALLAMHISCLDGKYSHQSPKGPFYDDGTTPAY